MKKRILPPLFSICLMIPLLVSCGKTESNPEISGPPKGSTYFPGSYTAYASGYGGKVEVMVVVSENEITAVSIKNHTEDMEYMEQVIRTIPDDILRKNSGAVDVVAGATDSSNAVLSATKQALTRARGEPAAVEGEGEVASESGTESENASSATPYKPIEEAVVVESNGVTLGDETPAEHSAETESSGEEDSSEESDGANSESSSEA